MPTEVIMPKVDMDMTTGRISTWHVSEGDTVTRNDPLFEIETDKAAMEVDSPATGRLFHVSASPGEEVAIGQAVAWIYADGEAVGEPPEPVSGRTEPADRTDGDAIDETPHRVDTGGQTRPVVAALPGHKPRATPLARSRARSAGLGLEHISGSGSRGRIVAADVEAAMARRPEPSATASSSPKPVWHPEDGPLALHGSIEGARAPHFFIHGFANDSAGWLPLEQARPSGRPGLRLDLPCHGRSPRRRFASFRDLARAVVEAFDRSGVDQAHLVGHSLGGALAIALADVRPRRVASLALICPAGLGPEIDGAVIDGIARASRVESLAPWLKCLVHDGDLISGSFVTAAMNARSDPIQRVAQADLAGVLFPDGVQSFDLLAALHRLAVPTKVIWGRQDRIIPWKHALRAPGAAALHLLDGVGHLPHVEQPDLVAILLDRLAAEAGT